MKDQPYSLEGERGVLGSILLEPSVISKVKLDHKDFYLGRHQVLFKALTDMHNNNIIIDAVHIANYLNDNKLESQVGGFDYLVELQDDTLVPHHSNHYATMVKDSAKTRQVLSILADGVDKAYDGINPIDHVLSSLISTGHSVDSSDESIEDLAEQFITDCEEGNVGHLPWWCDEWTKKMGKLSSELMIIHAPRSTGKTAIMCQHMVHAHNNGHRVPLASIEMLKKEIAPRFISHVGRVNTFTMRTRGFITGDEKQRAADATEKIRALNLSVREGHATIDDIRSWAYAEHQKGGVDAIYIDNLLSISDGGKQYQSKTVMYDDFIRKFRDLRDELKVPIIILAHPNSEGSIAWSKDVENFADVILYLAEVPPEGVPYRGRKIVPREDINGVHILAKFQKNRQGISPMASLEFSGDYQTFNHLNWEE